MRPRTIGAVRVTGLILWTATVALSQGIITTIAGADSTYPLQPLPALNAPLGRTTAVAVDARDNLYIADVDDSLVLKLDQRGILTVVAGNGVQGFSGDGEPATSASLSAPDWVAIDAAGNLFIVTLTVPAGLPAGPAPVIVSSAGQSSQAGVNLSIAGSQ